MQNTEHKTQKKNSLANLGTQNTQSSVLATAFPTWLTATHWISPCRWGFIDSKKRICTKNPYKYKSILKTWSSSCKLCTVRVLPSVSSSISIPSVMKIGSWTSNWGLMPKLAISYVLIFGLKYQWQLVKPHLFAKECLAVVCPVLWPWTAKTFVSSWFWIVGDKQPILMVFRCASISWFEVVSKWVSG